MKKSKGRIVILSGPSGSGKTTLHKFVLESPGLKGRLVKSISTTTREPRTGEKHGRDYLFLSEPMFRHKRRAGHFLESMKVFRHYYGTPNKNVQDLLKQGKHVLLCIDVKGARVVRRKYPEALKIFLKPPSMDILRQRLGKRGTEAPADLNLRLKTATKELKEAKYYDYVIVNDDLPRACRELERILYSELLGHPICKT